MKQAGSSEHSLSMEAKKMPTLNSITHDTPSKTDKTSKSGGTVPPSHVSSKTEDKGTSLNQKESQSMEERIRRIQDEMGIVGRASELRLALFARLSGRHLLLEGDVGVGKTTLALAIARYFHQPFYRVDGDERFNESKLVGYFDPPRVLEHGYTPDTFIAGPLTGAMQNGGVLFLNELNRLPEGTQNTLLPALDEGVIQIPKLPPVNAQPGFFVIATQNPQEHVGTTRLSEALRDRFTWIPINYQDADNEQKIVQLRISTCQAVDAKIAVLITRATRNHPSLRRGASVRGAIDLASLITIQREQSKGEDANPTETDWVNAAVMALATKIDREDGVETPLLQIIQSITHEVLQDFR